MNPVLEKFWNESGARFTELLNVGGDNPGGYGFIETGGLYGRLGLDQQEFFESITMQSFVRGVLAVLGKDAFDWLGAKIKEEEAQQEARNRKPDAVESVPTEGGAS